MLPDAVDQHFFDDIQLKPTPQGHLEISGEEKWGTWRLSFHIQPFAGFLSHQSSWGNLKRNVFAEIQPRAFCFLVFFLIFLFLSL